MAAPSQQQSANPSLYPTGYVRITPMENNNGGQSAPNFHYQQRCVQNPTGASGISQVYSGPVNQYYLYFGQPGNYNVTLNHNYGNAQDARVHNNRMHDGLRQGMLSPNQSSNSSGYGSINASPRNYSQFQ